MRLTSSDSRSNSVSSTCTTASAPHGIGAPVVTLITWPGITVWVGYMDAHTNTQTHTHTVILTTVLLSLPKIVCWQCVCNQQLSIFGYSNVSIVGHWYYCKVIIMTMAYCVYTQAMHVLLTCSPAWDSPMRNRSPGPSAAYKEGKEIPAYKL